MFNEKPNQKNDFLLKMTKERLFKKFKIINLYQKKYFLILEGEEIELLWKGICPISKIILPFQMVLSMLHELERRI